MGGEKGFGQFGTNLALSGIPVLGSLASAALQRGWAIKDRDYQNNYNLPINQVKRLRAAGLPLASMFSGSGGSQSAETKSSNVDPLLGTAKGIDNYFTNQMQRKQMQMLDEQIREQGAAADLKEGERDWLLKNINVPISPESPESEGGLFKFSKTTPQWQNLATEQKMKIAQTKTAEIIADLQQAKSQADIDHVLQTIELGKLNAEGQRIINKINTILTSNIGDKKWDLIQSMIYKLILK